MGCLTKGKLYQFSGDLLYLEKPSRVNRNALKSKTDGVVDFTTHTEHLKGCNPKYPILTNRVLERLCMTGAGCDVKPNRT